MRWDLARHDANQVEKLAAALGELPELRAAASHSSLSSANSSAARSEALQTLARLLMRRGLTEQEAAHHFLFPNVDHLHASDRMSGVSAAVARLDAAIERKEPMLIYGDYDVDGTMAIIVLKTAIELCGGAADFHVPHRIREGYDLRDDVIERAAAAGIRLIISVDMGIRAFAPAETAQRLGVDLIVTDHHLPGPEGVPRALTVVNPNQAGCPYPYKLLCGAGVAFKVAQALMHRRLHAKDHAKMLRSFMKVVAIATIADAVPLSGENRVFAKLGLEELSRAVNPGLKALLEVAQVAQKRAPNSTEVAFRIAPRINAAGRMDVARDVIELFSVKDQERARLLAGKLDRLNAERQEEERRILRLIEEKIAGEPELSKAYCIVVDGEGWHRGVIGIAATRVVEKYHRPALVISREGEQAHGSGRSIRAFHLLEAVEASRDLFSRYGGHSHACGFSMPAENVGRLRSQLDDFARSRLSEDDFDPVLEVEAELDLAEVTPSLYRVLRLLEPFGTGNHEPAFSARGVRLLAPPKILKEKHIKLKLKAREGQRELLPEAILASSSGRPAGAAIAQGNREAAQRTRVDVPGRKIVFDALGWHMAERMQPKTLLAGDAIDIAFTIGENDHPDFGGLELTLKDFKAAAATA